MPHDQSRAVRRGGASRTLGGATGVGVDVAFPSAVLTPPSVHHPSRRMQNSPLSPHTSIACQSAFSDEL